jgi:NAD(P)-dependent dehydrogenase (short-subunit alcohol dehydrogenase family)
MLTVDLVFGGRSPIAIAVAQEFAQSGNPVCLVTRHSGEDLTTTFEHLPNVKILECDLGEPGNVSRLLKELEFEYGSIRSISFLQRYRPAKESSFDLHMQVEVWAIREALELLLSRSSSTTTGKILISSSPAAQKLVRDQSLDYHIVKSAQESLVRFYAHRLSAIGAEIIGVRIGSVVLKGRAKEYWSSKSQLQANLSPLAFGAHLPTEKSIGASIASLAQLNKSGLSGQVLILDGGFSLHDESQAIKQTIEDLLY